MANSPPPEPSTQVLVASISEFGTELADLLNNTVTTNLRLTARWVHGTNDGRLGYKMDTAGVPTPIPLYGPSGEPCSYLYIAFRLTLNEAGYLVTTKSALRLYLDQGNSPSLFRYEYVRDYPIQYPNPHLHVEGKAGEGWEELNRRTGQKKGLGQLHFPVGGKRYRPSIEDFLEFLIAEGYVQERDGWQEAIEVYRGTYHERQLGAAVHANPDFAAASLKELGYKVRAPRR